VIVHRAFPYNASAADSEEGGALYVPPPTPLGRIANGDLYRELYFAAEPEAAIAEVFGFLPAWYPEDFLHATGTPYAVAAYNIDDACAVFNLNDSAALARVGIEQPSHVVTKRRDVTQAWARTIFGLHACSGVSWWSPYTAEWTVFGVWGIDALRVVGEPVVLTPQHPAAVTAATTIVRQIHVR
jgi:hypothetical protein